MTPQEQKVIEQALNALERQIESIKKMPIVRREQGECVLAVPESAWVGLTSCVHSIKEALAQPEQEPVAWVGQIAEGADLWLNKPKWSESIPLYTATPHRKPLTDEEIWDEVKAADLDWQTGWSLDEDASNRYITFARAIEAAHGITGENT